MDSTKDQKNGRRSEGGTVGSPKISAPLQQIHRPSRTTAIAFFLFSLAIAAFIIVWVFFLNKGTLAVSGETPFRITVSGKQKECVSSPCMLKLSPRTYNITIQKEEFYEDAQTVEIKRWEETKLSTNFTFIPVVAEAGELILPFPSAPLRPPFLGNKSFENFPRDSKEAYFSASGNRALIVLGKEIYLYDIENRAVAETNFSASPRPVWVSDDIIFLEETESKHVLKIWKGQKGEPIVTFERPFKNPKLIGAAGSQKVLIVDESGGSFSYYLVDIGKKSRRRLEINGNAREAKWAGEYLVFAEGEGVDKKIFVIHSETNKQTNKQILLSSIDTESVIERKPGILLFFSTEKQAEASSKFGTSISEAIEIAKKETFTPDQIPGTVFLTQFDVEHNLSQTLANIPVKDGKMPYRLTFDPSGKKIYFEMGGGLFEVILEK